MGIIAEKNIEKLIGISFKDVCLPDEGQKEAVLNTLLQKLPGHKKDSQPGMLNVIGLSALWTLICIISFSGLEESSYIPDYMKAALGLSLIFIPLTCVVLIIKLKSYEPSMF